MIVKFTFKNTNTGEIKTVELSDSMIRIEMEDLAFDALCKCDCQPVGETNVIDCNCEEYYEDFELVNDI